jgi:transposase
MISARPPGKLAALYKRRWQIELFFRWIKQTLKISRAHSARRARVAFLLLRLAHDAQNAVEGPLAFARLVRANLMHRRPINRLR